MLLVLEAVFLKLPYLLSDLNELIIARLELLAEHNNGRLVA